MDHHPPGRSPCRLSWNQWGVRADSGGFELTIRRLLSLIIWMKLSLFPFLILATCVVGCSTSRNNMSIGHVSPPHVTDINAHLTPGAYVEGFGEVETFELLGLKFSGGTQKRVGAIGNGLDIETQTPILNPMRLLFDSPANVQAAVDAAYYDAIDKNNSDGIISTRVQAELTGFTLFHIIGWGTATAKINGREVKITEGQLFRSSQNNSSSQEWQRSPTNLQSRTRQPLHLAQIGRKDGASGHQIEHTCIRPINGNLFH